MVGLPVWIGVEQHGVHAIINHFNVSTAKNGFGSIRGIPADRDQSLHIGDDMPLHGRYPQSVIKTLKWSFVGNKRRILNTMVDGRNQRKVVRQQITVQAGIDVDNVGPARWFGPRDRPRRILGSVRQPGDFGAQTEVPQPCCQPFGKNIDATARPNGREPHCRLDSATISA